MSVAPHFPDLDVLLRHAHFQLRRVPRLRAHLEAGDLASMAALRYLQEGSGVSPGTMVRSVAVDQLDHFRRQKRSEAMTESLDALVLAPRASTAGPDEALSREARAALLRAQGWTYRAIGAELKCGLSTAWWLVERARQSSSPQARTGRKSRMPAARRKRRPSKHRARVRELLRAGLSQVEIARQLRIQRRSVAYLAEEIRGAPAKRTDYSAAQCKRGHDLAENRVEIAGRPRCRACRRETWQAWSVRRRALAALLCLWLAHAAPAHAGSRCDELRAHNPTVLFCEDFETPEYNRAGDLRPGHAWFSRFGAATPGKSCEGPDAPCIVDVVAADQCMIGDRPGACVFDGLQSLGFPYRTGSDGGNLGEFRFSPVPLQSVGLTFAMRFSPGLKFSTPAKFDRLWGPQREVDGTVHELLGQNTDEGFMGKGLRGLLDFLTAGTQRTTPFQATWDEDTCPTIKTARKPCTDQSKVVVRAGQWGENDVHMVGQPEPPWSFPNGRWACVQMEIAGWGTADGRMRWSVDGVPLMDVDHVDLSRVRGRDKQGLYGVRFENYTNAPFQGSAYRYEDNWVVTGGAPVTCAEIGFAPSQPGIPAPPPVVPPAPPVLICPAPTAQQCSDLYPCKCPQLPSEVCVQAGASVMCGPRVESAR